MVTINQVEKCSFTTNNQGGKFRVKIVHGGEAMIGSLRYLIVPSILRLRNPSRWNCYSRLSELKGTSFGTPFFVSRQNKTSGIVATAESEEIEHY